MWKYNALVVNLLLPYIENLHLLDYSPLKNKENLISTLIVRAFRICSNYLLFDQEVKKLTSILQTNGYPLKFIERVIGNMLTKLYKPYDYKEVLNFDVPKAKVYFSTFYLGDISKQIAIDLKKIVSESYPPSSIFAYI